MNFFYDSNPELWYYMVGFLLAGGWIPDKNLIGVRLSIMDIDFLERMAKLISYKGKLFKGKSKYREIEGKEIHSKDFCQISFTSKIIADKLFECGLSCRKSGFEEYKNIPDEYFSSLLRGFMDGMVM